MSAFISFVEFLDIGKYSNLQSSLHWGQIQGYCATRDGLIRSGWVVAGVSYLGLSQLLTPFPTTTTTTTMSQCRDSIGIGQVMSGALFPLGAFFCILDVCCHVTLTDEDLLFSYSTIDRYIRLMECRSDGWLSGTFSHPCLGSAELSSSDHWLLDASFFCFRMIGQLQWGSFNIFLASSWKCCCHAPETILTLWPYAFSAITP